MGKTFWIVIQSVIKTVQSVHNALCEKVPSFTASIKSMLLVVFLLL